MPALQIVRPSLRTYKFDYGLRPDILTSNETTIYFQLSYHRGFIEFDLASGTVTRTKDLPARERPLRSPTRWPGSSVGRAPH